MSDQELKLSHKFFALLERMVASTPVHSLDLDVGRANRGVLDLDFSCSATSRELQWHMSTTVNGLPFSITTSSVEIVEQFAHPSIVDAAMESFQAHVVDLDVSGITNPVIHHYDDQLTLDTSCKVYDFFKQFKLQEKLFYSTTVHSIEIHTITVPIRHIPVTISTTVKENLLLFRRLTIERQPVELSYIHEKDQLVFWRNAVLKTKQEPRYLKMIGVYTGVPYYCIETEKITLNPTRHSLSYRFKLKLPAKMEDNDLKDIALFTLTPPAGGTAVQTPSLVMVKNEQNTY